MKRNIVIVLALTFVFSIIFSFSTNGQVHVLSTKETQLGTVNLDPSLIRVLGVDGNNVIKYIPFDSISSGNGGGTGTHTGTPGSIFFAGSNGLPKYDNANLFWGDSKNWMGVGINTLENTPWAIPYNAKLKVVTGWSDSDSLYNAASFVSAVSNPNASGAHSALLNVANHSGATNISTSHGIHNIVIGNASTHKPVIQNDVSVHQSSSNDDFRAIGVLNSTPDVLKVNYVGVENSFGSNKVFDGVLTGVKNYLDLGTASNRNKEVYGIFNDFIVHEERGENGAGTVFGVYTDIQLANDSTGNYNSDIFGTYINIDTDDTLGLPGGIHYGIYSKAHGSEHYAAYFSGNVVLNGTPIFTSDLKLKENVKNLTGALSLLDKLQPRTYNLKASEQDQLGNKVEHFGFIAQELRTVLPNLVKPVVEVSSPTRDDHIVEYKDLGVTSDGEIGLVKQELSSTSRSYDKEKLLGVKYIEIIPILVKGVKEQQAIIEDLATQIKTQKHLIELLEERVKKLEDK